MLTGARPGELVSAKRAAFDSRTKLLNLSGKTGPRDLPLTGAALALFERLAKSKLPGALLLTRDDGEPWTRIEWSRAIHPAVAAAEVKDERGKSHKLPAGVVHGRAARCRDPGGRRHVRRWHGERAGTHSRIARARGAS